MRSACLFSAVAAIAFFVTIDAPAGPEAAFRADFEPAVLAETLHLGLLAGPPAPEPVRQFRVL
jgi:hypothetical protein